MLRSWGNTVNRNKIILLYFLKIMHICYCCYKLSMNKNKSHIHELSTFKGLRKMAHITTALTWKKRAMEDEWLKTGNYQEKNTISFFAVQSLFLSETRSRDRASEIINHFFNKWIMIMFMFIRTNGRYQYNRQWNPKHSSRVA